MEIAVLGSLIEDRKLYFRYKSLISTEIFDNERRREIFARYEDYINADEYVDDLVLKFFEDGYDEVMEAVGVESIDQFHKYLILLNESADRRALKLAAQKVLQNIKKNEPADKSANLFFEASTKVLSKKQEDRDHTEINKALITIAEKAQSGEVVGMPSGLSKLDGFLGGLMGGLYVIAGRPGMGKSAQLITHLRHLLKQGYKCVLNNLEMPEEQIHARFFSQETGLSASGFIKGLHKVETVDHAITKCEYLKNLTIIRCDKIKDLYAKCKQLDAEGRIDVLGTDYLQLMTSDDKDRRQQIETISRQHKLISLDLDIPVIALSQLSRNVESRPDKQPNLSDLRESGAIEQDADVVMFAFRPEYYNLDWNGFNAAGKFISLIAKNRNGASNVNVELGWNAECMSVIEESKLQPNEDFENPF